MIQAEVIEPIQEGQEMLEGILLVAWVVRPKRVSLVILGRDNFGPQKIRKSPARMTLDIEIDPCLGRGQSGDSVNIGL